MAVGIPLPTNYTDGEVWSAADVNDITGTINTLGGGGYAAGKNKFINADMRWNQRNFTSTTTGGGTYGLDRFKFDCGGGTATYSAQAFTAGSAPVAGYEAINYARVATTGQSGTADYAILTQQVEDVRTLSGQTATISFWAKAGTGTPKVAVEIEQFFGSGGSPSATVRTYVGQVTLTTSWVRYSLSIAIPSMSGKTIGTTANTSSAAYNFWTSAGSVFNSRTGSLGVQNATIDFWGVQLEAGSTATAFQTATGTIQGELAACQRYYYRHSPSVQYTYYGQGNATSTTNARIFVVLPVQLRVVPTSLDYANLAVGNAAGVLNTVSTATMPYPSVMNAGVDMVTTGLTTGASYFGLANTASTSYIGFSAEL